MNNSEIENALFLKAVEAIDSGNISALEKLIFNNPGLVTERLDYPTDGYFRNPFLLWFIADNPIRIDKLPANIVGITSMIIKFVKQLAGETVKEQLDYTLGLVATGRIPKECGVQIELMDLLIDAGATPGGGLGAFAHGNIDAARHLIKRGGTLTLTAAVCLDQMEDVITFAPLANPDEQLVALTAAGFCGKPLMISYLLGLGVSPNGYPKNNKGFHSHATPLHQAVSSGSIESVRLLVEAGADLNSRDHIYDGTPLDWASHIQSQAGTEEKAKSNLVEIADYLNQMQRRGNDGE